MLRRAYLYWLVVPLLGLIFCLIPGPNAAGAAGGKLDLSQRWFLDLPEGFARIGDEEDEPEIIEFYNEQYEGDAFVFVLDRSSSMGQAAQNGRRKFDILKDETIRALSAMSERSVASVVFYDASIRPLVYGEPPIRMTPANKSMLIAQVAATPLGRGSCMLRGVLKALELIQRTREEHRTIILTSDGRTTCPNGERDPDRIFQAIMAHNPLRIPINTIYTGPQQGSDWEIGKPLLERIAQATGGKFKIAR